MIMDRDFDTMGGQAGRVVTTPAHRFTSALVRGTTMPQEPTRAQPARQTRADNPNWRGGRLVASNGYVLIRVGTDHPMADVRGYVYEHRLVMAQVLDRTLATSEIVHHKNEIKTDNRPDNLEVVVGNAEHFVRHRTRSDLRLPGEPNPEVLCACGCGATFSRFDATGRPRDYVSGHNRHKAPVSDEVCLLLARFGPLTNSEILELMGRPSGHIKTILCRLYREGKIDKIARGVWKSKEDSDG